MIPVRQYTQNETLKTLEPEFDAIEIIKDHAYYKAAMDEKERLAMIDRV